MIVTDHMEKLVTVTVYGEFSLGDYKEFEELVNYKVKFEGPVNLLFDLRQMADFTLDMAWEEIRFSRAHSHDFGRIAVLTDSQWVTWSAWLSQIFVDADLQVFADEQEARNWLQAA
ncbi:MAG: STAS/SEC14 domain-containing protein [Sulfuritalea sp.]|nr:STAS/SEC14 domain-containing protein [Sulfuritalea sp.]